MTKDSMTSSFIVRVKWVNEELRITLQNIHTREVLEMSNWPELFKELVVQPASEHALTQQDDQEIELQD